VSDTSAFAEKAGRAAEAVPADVDHHLRRGTAEGWSSTKPRLARLKTLASTRARSRLHQPGVEYPRLFTGTVSAETPAGVIALDLSAIGRPPGGRESLTVGNRVH